MRVKLFAGERALVAVSIVGFALAIVCAFFWFINGAVVLPEGDLNRAFSFNAAIAIYMLSIAAIMPLSGLTERGRRVTRWMLISMTYIGYGIENVQHFRGIDPRFSQVGSVFDFVMSILFGVVSIVLIVFSGVLAASFFRKRVFIKPSSFIIGTRYAFISTMLAFLCGLIMIILQSRYAGEGNFIVIHGLGFHALQTLPFLGWLTERTNWDDRKARTIVHCGSTFWMVAIVLLFVQTVIGRTVFEWSLLPLLAGISLFIWLIVSVYGTIHFIRNNKTKNGSFQFDLSTVMTVKTVSK